MKRNGVGGEEWYCVNCGVVGELDIHARCGKCGSDAIISCERLPQQERPLTGIERMLGEI